MSQRVSGQPREMRGRVWDDSSKEESKAGKFPLLDSGRAAAGLGIDTAHPTPDAGLRVQRLTVRWQRWQRWRRRQLQRSRRARPSSCRLAPRPGSASPGPATRPPARSHPRRAATSQGTIRNQTRPAPGG